MRIVIQETMIETELSTNASCMTNSAYLGCYHSI